MNRASPRLRSLGACGTVTGSRFLFEGASERFQAPGTRGADLAAGARQLKALGRYVPVRCQVEAFQGMSVHADADELVAWLAGGPALPAPDVCYVVHGEHAASRALADRLRIELGWLAVVPADGELVRLD